MDLACGGADNTDIGEGGVMPVAAGAGQKIGEIAVFGLPDFQRGAAQADMREMQRGGDGGLLAAV